MHPTSFNSMVEFKNIYMKGVFGQKVLDVGALDLNGSYKKIFINQEYIGLDIKAGPNVQIIPSEPYNWPIEDDSFDAVICGQVLEHVEDDTAIMKEMVRVLKPNGLICIIVPSAGPEHDKPDYRRYTRETLTRLAMKAGLDLLECNYNPHGDWKDITLVAQKPMVAPKKKGRPKKVEENGVM